MDASGQKESSISSQELFQRHLTLLQEHLSLWNVISEERSSEATDRGLAHTCLDNTQKMIENMTRYGTEQTKSSGDAAANATIGEPTNGHTTVKSSKTRSRSRKGKAETQTSGLNKDGPVEDSSGLFAIDTNPTPVDILIEQTNPTSNLTKKQKRRLSETQLPTKPIAVPQTSQTSTPNKKQKKEDISTTPASGDDSFAQRVQKRISAKDAKRLRKLDKKRKHDSDAEQDPAAPPPINPSLINHLVPEPRPKKRRKQEIKAWIEAGRPDPTTVIPPPAPVPAAAVLGIDETSVPTQPTAEKPKERFKKRSKRLSAAANGGAADADAFLKSMEFPEGADEDVDDGVGHKRKRRRRSKGGASA